jgi:hypothetical protein
MIKLFTEWLQELNETRLDTGEIIINERFSKQLGVILAVGLGLVDKPESDMRIAGAKLRDMESTVDPYEFHEKVVALIPMVEAAVATEADIAKIRDKRRQDRKDGKPVGKWEPTITPGTLAFFSGAVNGIGGKDSTLTRGINAAYRQTMEEAEREWKANGKEGPLIEPTVEEAIDKHRDVANSKGTLGFVFFLINKAIDIEEALESGKSLRALGNPDAERKPRRVFSKAFGAAKPKVDMPPQPLKGSNDLYGLEYSKGEARP